VSAPIETVFEVLKLAGPPIREQLTAFDPPNHFAYRALSGIPVRSHTGTVELRPDGDRTRVTWLVDSVPSLPLPGAVWAAAVRPGISLLLRAVVKESERRARAGG